MTKNLSNNANIFDRYFDLSIIFQALIWLAVILIIKYDTVLAPPIWDSTSGIFAPAIFLSESGFDILSLIQQNDWWLGGPNVHSFSLWTWLTAGVMYLTSHPVSVYLFLHLLTYVLSALAIAALLKCIDRYGVDRSLIILGGILFISTPLILVQVGFMYTEVPVMCFSVFAFYALQRNKEWYAVIFSLIALSIKLTGLAIAVSVGLIFLYRFIVKPTISRFVKMLSLGAVSIFFMSIYSWLGGVVQTHGMNWGESQYMLFSLKSRLASIPDVRAFLLVGFVASVVVLILVRLKNPKLKVGSVDDNNNPINDTYFALPILLLTFSAAICYATYQGYLFLPRYILPMIPFALISMLVLVQVINSVAFFRVFGLILICQNIVNFSGKLYTYSSSFSIAETTHSYRGYTKGHSAIIEGISRLPNDVPIYISREIGYMTYHPMMGRLSTPKPNLRYYYLPEYSAIEAADLPEEFYYVISTYSRIHGGAAMRKNLGLLRLDPKRKVTEIYSNVFNGIKMGIYRVQTKPMPL